MTAQTWNKITAAVGSDGWNPVVHMKGLADTSKVIIPVADVTERNGLAALAPGGVLPDGTAVERMDLIGQPLETWDASASIWRRQISPVIQANTQTVGSGMATNAFTTGTLQPIIQAGTFVGTTTASGDLTITYPTVFPGGVIGGIGFSGDGVYIVSATPSTVASPTTSSLFLRFALPGGGAVVSTTVRGTWMAVGW